MKCLSNTQFFEVFANETRLRIIESLMAGEKCVTDICDDIGEEQSKVSHNLRVLLQCNFLNKKTDGKKRVYSLNSKTIKPLMKLVEQHVKYHCENCCMVKK